MPSLAEVGQYYHLSLDFLAAGTTWSLADTTNRKVNFELFYIILFKILTQFSKNLPY